MKKSVAIFLSLFVGLIIGIICGIKLQQYYIKGESYVYINEGNKQFKDKLYDNAIASFNRALALDNNSLIANIGLAETYYENGNYEMALKEYENVKIISRGDNDGRGILLIEDKIKEIKIKIYQGNIK
jgi:tetratricopeptide (TPR) repeat protein